MEMHEVTKELFGPLALLAGDWEGSDGIDFSSPMKRPRPDLRHTSKVQLKPFGPINNAQHLYGLDYGWLHGE